VTHRGEPGFFRTELLTPESTTYAEPSIDDYAERTRQTVAASLAHRADTPFRGVRQSSPLSCCLPPIDDPDDVVGSRNAASSRAGAAREHVAAAAPRLAVRPRPPVRARHHR
jgi:hypothetical protein